MRLQRVEVQCYDFNRMVFEFTRHLRQGRHGRHDIYDLEALLLAAKNTLLACDHDRWHRAEQGTGGQV